MEEDYYCQCGRKMKRAGIIEDGKIKLTKCKICPSCGVIVKECKDSKGDYHNTKEDKTYELLCKILLENEKIKNALCLPKNQSAQIKKIGRAIPLGENNTLLEEIEKIQIESPLMTNTERILRKKLFSGIDQPGALEKIIRMQTGGSSIKESLIKKGPILTEPEQLFEDLCKKYGLPFQYVGNKRARGKLNPDFIHTSKRIVVEIMGDYWHSPLLNFKLKLKECTNLNYREKYYKEHNLMSIFIWETDLKRVDAEQFVLNVVTPFL